MRPDWWRCDGDGTLTETRAAPRATRRQALLGAALGAVAWAARGGTALAEVALTPGRRDPHGDVLVSLFLRGGADGLNIVVPHGDDAYHRNRPTIGIGAKQALDLDGFFGLHPALAPLHPLYKDGLLSCVHACGSGDQTRSHFEAMAAMERGLDNDRTGVASGWLARYLSGTQGDHASPLRAVAFSSILPDVLRGATDATAVNALADFRFYLPDASPKGREEELRKTLATFYQDGQDAVAYAGRETLAVLETLNRIDPARYRPASGAVYPESDLGNGLRQVACLIKGRVGLEVACLDRGGWDTHVTQGSTGGWLAMQLDDVAKSVAAFMTDLGPERKRVTLVIQTEFGRRVRENSGLGTDHGRASMLLLLGGGIVGGRVFANWPGLDDDRLEPPGDLRVTTDYRDILGEIVAKRLRPVALESVFPGYTPRFVGVAASPRAS